MAIELKVPELGESITEVEIGDWFKKEGDQVGKDDPIVALESDKATVELSSPEAGTISKAPGLGCFSVVSTGTFRRAGGFHA